MKASREPPIVILKNDFEKLRGYASSSGMSPVSDYLANELDRANVVDDPSRAERVVRLGSRVRYKDSANNIGRNVTLVLPNDADISVGRVSVLTPVGAALLGLSVGQEITYTPPNGTERSLRVVEIRNA